MQRWLQTDLGFYFADKSLIGTTHVGMANIGLDPEIFDPTRGDVFEQLGKQMFEFSHEIGIYLGILTEILPPPFPTKQCRAIDTMGDLCFTAEDYKAEHAYRLLRERLGLEGTPYAPVVTWMISQVNFVHLLLPRMLPPDSDIQFRARFLTVYHALNGLRKLSTLARHRRDARIVRTANEILGTPAARVVRRLEKLRDAAAHYDLAEAEGALLQRSTLRALVPIFCRRSFDEVSALLDDCLTQMSTEFGKLVSARVLGASIMNRHDFSREARVRRTQTN